MSCITCKSTEEILAMEEQIKKLASQGFDANRIAAMLMIHKHIVVDVLSAKEPVSTVKTKKSKVPKLEE